MTGTRYDAVTYPGYAYEQTHPDRLATQATLFGMSPGPPAACRVLEIGAGDGELAAALREGGVQLEGDPKTEVFGQRHFFVRDPAGTWIDVIQLVEPDPDWAAANLPTT